MDRQLSWMTLFITGYNVCFMPEWFWITGWPVCVDEEYLARLRRKNIYAHHLVLIYCQEELNPITLRGLPDVHISMIFYSRILYTTLHFWNIIIQMQILGYLQHSMRLWTEPIHPWRGLSIPITNFPIERTQVTPFLCCVYSNVVHISNT